MMSLRPKLTPRDGDGSTHEIPENYDFMNIISDTVLPEVRPGVVERVRPLPDDDVYDIPLEWFPGPYTELVPQDTSALDIEPTSRRQRRAWQRSRNEEQRAMCPGSGDVGTEDSQSLGSFLAAGTGSSVEPPVNSSRPACNKQRTSSTGRCKEVNKKDKLTVEQRKQIESAKRLFDEYGVGPPPPVNSLWYLKDTLKFRCLLKRTQEIVQRQLQDLHHHTNLMSKL